MAVLDRHDPAGQKALTIADPINIIDDRHLWIARAHEVAMQRVNKTFLRYGSRCGDKGLTDDLAPENPLPTDLRTATTKQIAFQWFKVEYIQKILNGAVHRAPSVVIRRRQVKIANCME